MTVWKGKILTFALLMLSVAFAWIGCGADRDPVSSAPEELAPAAKIAGGGIPDRYIVVLRDEVDDVPGVAARLAHAHGGVPEHVYQHALKGFSVAMPEQAVEALAHNPQVAYIEPDQIATIVGAPAVTGKPGGGGSTPPPQIVPWGITRIGGAADGTGKTAWVIDTGIDLDHPDLVVDGARSRDFNSDRTTSPDDGHGHGTHVAGTIAARNNPIGVIGVAAGATVVAVRVLDNRGSGSYSNVIAGVDYVAANGAIGDVANMSLGGPVSEALDTAVRNAASAGVRFSLAAGNESDNANNHSPARANGANIYTVSAIGATDVFASFSNYGNPPVDYAAPGVSITSCYKGGGYATMSGTSMAAPHVAGILLLGPVVANGTASGDPDGNLDPIAHR